MTDFKEIGANFVEHHGVKGQRWGVRRSNKELGKKSDSDGNKSADEHKTDREGHTTVTGGKRMADMSDAELKRTVARINMEQQYAKLTYKPTVTDRGKKFAGELLVNVAKQQIAGLLNAQASAAIAQGMGKQKQAKLAKARKKAGIPNPPAFRRAALAAPNAADRLG
jgi:hypothetical protein